MFARVTEAKWLRDPHLYGNTEKHCPRSLCRTVGDIKRIRKNITCTIYGRGAKLHVFMRWIRENIFHRWSRT